MRLGDRRRIGAQLALDLPIKPRHLLEERIVVIGEPVQNLVAHSKLRQPEQTRLPKNEHGAAYLVFDLGLFLRGPLLAIAPLH